MKNKFVYFILLLLLLSKNGTAQLKYSVVGAYMGKSAQGMAIWENKAFLFNDGGYCRVLNLETKKVERSFYLASAGNNTHVNAACFGKERVHNDRIPLVYISEYNNPSRCFVESINDSSSTIVQTIQIIDNGKPVFVQSWIPDKDNNYLYAITRLSPPKGEKNSTFVGIRKFRLPSLTDGNSIFLTPNDCLDFFVVSFASGIQGGVIKGKYLYLPTGLQESARGNYNAERAIQVIDLKKKKLVKRIDLTFVTTNEPEDIDFYKNKALLYCGQEGGIYKIRY